MKPLYLQMIAMLLCGFEILETEGEALCWIASTGEYIRDLTGAETELYLAAIRNN